jgi:hypothetical protein
VGKIGNRLRLVRGAHASKAATDGAAWFEMLRVDRNTERDQFVCDEGKGEVKIPTSRKRSEKWGTRHMMVFRTA